MKAISRSHTLIRVLLIIGLLMSSIGPAVYSQQTARAATDPEDISYMYDEAGRLSGVVDPAGDAATYTYDEVGNIRSISRQPATQLGLIEFTPNAAPVGATVTLYGTGFNTTVANNIVKFNGVTATVTSATATELVVSVPSGATTGAISITTGTSTVTSSQPFTVNQAAATPQVTAINPMVGGAGTVVTIDGANFEPVVANNKVAFNGTLSHLTSATTTRLETSVPNKASSGRISVATPAGKVVSSSDFFVPPTGFTAADIDVTGRMAIGESKALTLGTANKIAMILFDGNQGQQISLNLTSVTIPSSSVSILAPDGTTLNSISIGTNGGFLDTRTLPATGTYTILVDPASTYTGNITLTLYESSDVISPITIGGPAVNIATPVMGKNARLTFNGTAGQRVSLNLSSVTIPSSYVSIFKPDGTALTSAAYIGTGGGFIDAHTLPVTGAYTILVDPQGTYTGQMTLTLYEASDVTGTITPGGAAVTVTTTTPGQNARLTFSGTQSQRVSLNLSNGTLQGSYISILKPDGTALVSATYVGTSGFIDVQTLPVAGTYTIVVDGYSNYTGRLTLTLYDVPADVASPIVAGTTVTVTTTVPGQNARLTFDGTQGQRISLNLSNGTLQGSYISILKPDNTALVSATYVGTSGFIDAQTLPATGTYTVVVDGYTNYIGRMALTLYNFADLTSTITPGGPAQTVTLASPGQNARLTFDGTANQRVSLNLSNGTLQGSYVSILKPDGTALVSATYVGTSGFIDTKTLPATGTYTLVVDGYSNYTGRLTLTLYDVPADITGPIVIAGSTVTVTTTVPGQNARLTFDGTQGQRISLSLSNGTLQGSYVSILKPDNTALVSATYVGTSGFIDAQTLPATGTYTIVVDGYTNYIGRMALTLYNAGDVTGTITPGGPAQTVTLASPGQNARLTFSGTQGQQISLSMSSVTLAGSYVSILKPDGTSLASSGYIGTGGGSIDAKILPATGTYTIVVDGYSNYTGRMTLTLYDVPTDITSPIVAGGSPVTVTTTVAGQNARLTFDGTQGQRVSISVGGVTISSSYVSLLKPDGTTLTSTSFGTGGTFIDVQTLPVAGTYTILIDPQSTATGRAVVTLHNAGDVTGTITPGGAAVTVTTTAPGQNGRVTFSGTQGQRVSLNLSSVTLQGSYISILKPDGTSLTSATYIGTGGGFIDVQTLPTTGTYTVLVDGYSNYTGRITITLYDVPADVTAPIVIAGSTVTVTTTVPGQNARLTFSGTQGQRVSLSMSSVTFSGSYVSILKPDNTALVSATYIGTGGGFIDAQTLPSTGTYTIVVDGNTNAIGRMALTLYNAGDVTGTITPGGAAVTVTTTAPGQNARLTFEGAANQRISLNLSNGTLQGSYISILKPDGTALVSATYVGTSGFIDIKTLPTTGTYTIVVDGYSNYTGRLTLTLYDVPADVASPIVAGTTVTVTTTVPGQNARLTFDGTQGQRISLNLSNGTLQGSYISILKPDNTALVSATYVGTSGFIDAQTLPATGTYTIVVDGNSNYIGRMALTLYNFADLTSTITPGGAAATVTLASPGQNARLTFSGTAGQRISLNLSNGTLQGSYISILKPDNTALVSATYVGTSGFIDTKALPTTGTYTIVVDGYSNYTGRVTLTLYDVPADVTAPIVIAGSTVTVTTTVPGQNARLTFDGTQGQRISLNLGNGTLQGSYISILKPDNTALVSATYVGTSGFIDAQTLPATGTYTIVVDGYTNYIGRMALTLYNASDVTGTITPGGAAQTVTLASPGQNARLTFSGTAGQRISLNLSNGTLQGSYISILKPDNTALVSATYIGTSGFIDTKALPSTGTYTIVVDGYSTYTGRLTLTLYDVPADLSGSIAIGGAAVTVTPSVPGQNAKLTFDGTANQRIRLTINGVTIPGSYVSILKPDNTALVSATYISTSGGSLTPTVPAAGSYSIVVDPTAANTGSMTLTLAVFTASGPSLQTAAAQAAPVQADIHTVRTQSSATLGTPIMRAITPDEKLEADQDRAGTAQQDDGEFWAPDLKNLRNWKSGRPRPHAQDLPPLQAKVGVTALTGQVLDLKGRPLSSVTLKIDDHAVTTDNSGRFLMEGLEPGRHELVIDGRTASKPGRAYGLFEVSAQITAGQTNILPYTIWLPKLDTKNTIKITSPTTEEIVLTTPYIPGLEVRIPKGAVITDEDDKPLTETEIGITPIPTDRTPFPLPANAHVPIYFTIQPGGAYVKPFARIIYPNYDNEPEGRSISFFHYEPEDMDWFIYGQGTVMPGGKQIVPNPGVGIYEFTGAMIGTSGNPPGDGPTPGNDDDDGDPVDLSTGMFVLDKTDLVVPDVMPLSLTRTYRPKDTVSRPFGIGTTHPYEMFLWSARQYQEVDAILPDGGRIHYVRISAGTGYTDAVFEHTGSGSLYHKSRVQWNGNGWDLVLKDGTIYSFPMYSPLQSIRDRNGNRITLTRSGGNTGNITQITTSNGRWLTFSYDASNRITQAKDNVGRTVNYAYDAGGRLWKVTDPAGGVTEHTYDASHRMLTIKDARGITFLTNEYDANSRVRKQTQADGTTYLFAYTLDANGKVTRTDVTDPRGQVRRTTFNANGYTLTDAYAVGRPEQQTVTYEREANTNLLLSSTDPAGRKTAYTYDAMGNLTSLTRLADTPNAITTRLTYDSRFNRVAGVTDPLGHSSSFTYNTKGHLVSITDPLGRRATLTYNGAGQVVAVTDPLNHTTRLTYEGSDVVAMTDPLGRVTSRFTDSIGRLVSQTNPRGQSRRFDYNALSLPLRQTDPLGAITEFAYDQNGNLVGIKDARGNITSYVYNNMDRLASRTDPLGRAEQYQYDGGGNVVQVTDRKGQVSSFRYDDLNRNTFAGFGMAGGANPTYQSSLTYAYNAANLIAKITDSQTGDITFTYDGLNRLVNEASAQGSIGYAYDAAGRQVSMQTAGQPAVGYTYDAANRLTQIAQGSATVTMAYDDASRLITKNLPTGVSMGYTYDDASQMTGISYQLGTNTIGDLSYTYDANGKVAKVGGSYGRTGIPQAVNSATYDAANRLVQWGSQALSYDANGNLTNDGSSTYTWNARNQLAGISGASTTAGFQYDGTGRRIGKTVNSNSVGFMHDGRNVVQELSNGSPVANLLTGLGIDQTFSRSDANGTQTLLTDRLGSTLALVDASGAVQTQYTYDPFGNTSVSGAPNANASQYTGRENDGTGLYYYRARYYSPTFQRFISEDPLGFAGGDINLYAYVGNSPTNFTDPRGLFLDTLVDIGFIGYDLYKLFTGGRKNLGENLTALGLDVAGALIPFATGLGAAGRAASHADDAYDGLRAASKGCSFSGDTPVSTEDGAQPIREIKVGDRVLAYNEETGSTGSYTVTAVWSNRHVVTEQVTIDGEHIETTPEHPFYSEQHGWIAAGHLQVGAKIRTADGTPGTVEAVEFARDPQPMYNLTVDQAHTYYVGEEQALVHNSCPVVQIPRSRYPETAKHVEDAQAAGHPSELTIDRGGAKSNRSESLKGHPTVPGKDRDEYPPAMFKEGGNGASVRPINPSDNRGAGSCMSHQCSAYPDGTKVRVEVVP